MSTDFSGMPQALEPFTLPSIDMSPFLSPSPDPVARQATAQALHDACIRFGFFYCTGFEGLIWREEMLDVIAVTREYLARLEEEKERVGVKPEGDKARGACQSLSSPFLT